MEAICSSEMFVDIQRITWNYIPEDSTLHNHRCENLKSYIVTNILKESDAFISRTTSKLGMEKSGSDIWTEDQN
jgi:hypothetical protein